MKTKNLGKIVGHCPQCFLPVTKKELYRDCKGCGYHLLATTLSTENRVTFKQTIQQSAMARYFPGYDRTARR